MPGSRVYFGAAEGSRLFRAPVAALGWRSQFVSARETKDDLSSQIIVRSCGIGFCRVRGHRAGAGADHAGMQCEISGRQDRGHPERAEVERFPQGPVRRGCDRHAAAAAPAAAPAAPPAPKEAEAKPKKEAAPRPLRHRRRPSAMPCSRTRSIRNMPRKAPARGACTPASINTMPTRPTNGNGGMKWIEKGGGYYSECNKQLKG